MLGGFWSSYYYNGFIYGSEIQRGFDVFKATGSEFAKADRTKRPHAERADAVLI